MDLTNNRQVVFPFWANLLNKTFSNWDYKVHWEQLCTFYLLKKSVSWSFGPLNFLRCMISHGFVRQSKREGFESNTLKLSYWLISFWTQNVTKLSIQTQPSWWFDQNTYGYVGDSNKPSGYAAADKCTYCTVPFSNKVTKYKLSRISSKLVYTVLYSTVSYI